MFLRYFSTLYGTTYVKTETDLRFMNYFNLVEQHKINYSHTIRFVSKIKIKISISNIILT